MKPAAFEYHRAYDLAGAVDLLAELGEDAKLLAGGMSLVAMMNFRLARPSALVDLTRIDDLSYLRRDDDGALRIGALTTHHSVETGHEVLGADFAVLPRAARFMGHYPIRTRGTFGGSIAHCDSTAEWCLLALLLDAQVVVTSRDRGTRTVAAGDFLLGFFTTALEPDEAVVEVVFPRPAPHAALTEFAQRKGDFAVVAAAVDLDLPDGAEGRCRGARVALGGVDAVVVRVPEAEALLADAQPGEDSVAGGGRRGGRRDRARLGRPRERGAPPHAHPDPAGAGPTGGERGRGVTAGTPARAAEPRADADGRWVGARIPRREDPRLLTGHGRFVDDLAGREVRHAAFVRSPVAVGRITGIDVTAVPDGVAVLDAGRLAAGDLAAVLDRPEFVPMTMPVLARDRVCHVGEPVALVVAEDPYAAEDAAEAVVVDYEPGVAVTDLEAALAARAPRVHPDAVVNTVLDVRPFDDPGFDTGADDDPFATAAHVVTSSVRSARVNAVPLESRACRAEWNAADEQLVVHVSSQVPHQVRTAVARAADLPEHRVRVVVPDVGGGFGLKCVVGREEVAVAVAALRTGAPVAWAEDRREQLTASFHGHEQVHDLRAAVAADGTLLALDADIRCDVGAYSVFPFTHGVEPLMAAHELPGVYRVPRYRVRARAVATHKAPTAPYRGVSRPQIVLATERLMARIAAATGLDPVEVRRRNLIDEFPWTGANGITYDAGSYRASLDRCEALLRDEGWYARRDEAGRTGRHLGIGIACFNERTGYGTGAFAARGMDVVPGPDLAEARMDPSGTVLVTSGTCGHGQGHETTLAQVAADQLGLHPDRVRVRQGDTDLVPHGWGTFASRSAVVGGAAVSGAAAELARKVRRIAAHLLEAAVEDVELVDGRAVVQGTPVGMPVAEVARVALLQSHRLPRDVEPGLSAHAVFDVEGSGTFSNATHGVVCELEEGTGAVRLLRYVVVEDCGVVINPQVVDGQVRGGVAQGIAAALYEAVRYDEEGNPTSASLMDYLVPTAHEVPVVDVEHLETPCAFSRTGAKGMGEGGAIGAPAAVLDAVNDALRGTGVALDTVPVRPEDVAGALGRSRGTREATR